MMRFKAKRTLLVGFLLLFTIAACSPAEPTTTEQEEQEFPVSIQSIEEGTLEKYLVYWPSGSKYHCACHAQSLR